MAFLCLTAAFLDFLFLNSLVPLTAAAAYRSDDAFAISSQLTIHKESSPPLPPADIGHGLRYTGDDFALNSIAFDPLEELQAALHVMQTTWFDISVGSWATAIDWTRAVIDTHLVCTIGTLSRALDRAKRGGGGFQRPSLEQCEIENEINHYFGQNTAYYFGENAFRIRFEAYDDMLWVVLGWLESVKFIRTHSKLHCGSNAAIADESRRAAWHGTQFVEAFAHRARVFYDLASHGWDEKYCGGGMVWSPNLGPYKNAITNELYISASIGMYLYFPGDNSTSPFVADSIGKQAGNGARPYDAVYLQNAIDGYAWLNRSGMTNRKGLYTDGFHISNWRKNGTECDERNDMIYTYNQGVLLSGFRGLWEGTGNSQYLEDGHGLTRHVIKATGWDLELERVTSADWAGIGRNGILEDHCDAAGRCSQDAQMFKSIFFHHLALFCEPLPLEPTKPGKTQAADKALAHLHHQSCKTYAPWVAHNAQAALKTRDEHGRFGMWWGADEAVVPAALPIGAVDYRNNGTETLGGLWTIKTGVAWSDSVRQHNGLNADGTPSTTDSMADAPLLSAAGQHTLTKTDLNDRGRGRTVETQAGGVAVLRCLWELMNLP